MVKEKAIAIDFDKTIHRYSKGYLGGEIYDPPFDGCRKALELLQEQGYKIIIYSVRNLDHPDHHTGKLEANQIAQMKTWFKNYHIPYDSFWTEPGKPQVDLFIDDKGYRFTGNWSTAVFEVLNLLQRKVK